MKILYDHQTFSLQKYGGISRYHVELITGINKTPTNQASASLLLTDNIHIHEAGLKVPFSLPKQHFPGKGRVTYYINQLYSLSQVRKKNYDIFHATYYDPYFLPHVANKPFVVTFHDMIYEKFSEQYPNLVSDNRIIDNKKLLAEKADRIVAVSEHTKKDMVEILNIDPNKIEVIYHGSSLQTPSQYETSVVEPYLLFVGNRGGYKNFQGLLVAIQSLLKKYSVKLICAGGGPFTPSEQKNISDLALEQYVEQQPITDQTLPLQYHQAVAFIFPSIYEGFGIPILEAFACDCPCIVSNTSSLPEVAGDAALYFDPLQGESIANAVERMLTDSTLRQSIIEKGREQLKLFSWPKAVSQTIDLYQSLL
ncbi:glycosyltransferase family 1 protein [Spirosoma daeguense]